jgi:hypothetical protein
MKVVFSTGNKIIFFVQHSVIKNHHIGLGLAAFLYFILRWFISTLKSQKSVKINGVDPIHKILRKGGAGCMVINI